MNREFAFRVGIAYHGQNTIVNELAGSLPHQQFLFIQNRINGKVIDSGEAPHIKSTSMITVAARTQEPSLADTD